jgi:two-component system, NtrC family, sensor histidine kinase HydH
MGGADRYALLSMAVRIANSGNRSPIARLASLSKFLVKTFALNSATIYILDEDRRRLSRYISGNGRARVQHCQITLGEGVAGRCAAEKKELRLASSVRHPDEVHTGSETELLALPLGDWGVITLGYIPGYAADTRNVVLLNDLVAPVAGLLERFWLAEASERRVRNLTRLGEMGQTLNRPMPPRLLITRALGACMSYGESVCVILRLLEGKGVPSGIFKKYSPTIRPGVAELLGIEAISSGRVLKTGHSLLIRDLIAEGHFPSSYVTVPLPFKTKALGTLTFFGKRGRGGSSRNFDEEDRDLFENMALLVANALAEAANFERLLAVSGENDKKLKELSLLYNFSNVMLSTVRLDRLVQLILTALVSGPVSFFERAMLLLFNERTEVLQGMLGVTRETSEGMSVPGMDDSTPAGLISGKEPAEGQDTEFNRMVRASRLELKKSRNVCSRAVLGKRVILVTDPQKEKRIDRDFVRNFGMASFAVAPLMAKERVIGVVIVDNPSQTRAIGNDDLRFLQLFTNQAGMAMENSMLYSRLTEANRSLREARERFIHGSRLATIGTMAASIAHELKGPLVSIGGFARRLSKILPPGSNESNYAGTIVQEVQRLEKMLTEILSYTRKTTICYSQCTIRDIVEDSLSIVTPALEEKDITVTRSFPAKPVSLLADGQQLKQVFINLFLNSHEAMNQGGRLDITVTPARLKGVKAVSIKVADSGGGVPPDTMNKIFNPFYTTKESGTGLGLPIADRIVTNHGGQIQVKNSDIGAEFTILLPLAG